MGESERDQEKRESRERAALRSMRSQLNRLTSVIRFADFMALLMVVATVFSAYAAWRAAQVARLIFEVSQRPFIGVQRVSFEGTDSAAPSITVDLRNFGPIPAVGAVVKLRALVNGEPLKPLRGEMSTTDAGIVSPGVPHFFYAFIPANMYKQVVTGSSPLMVHINIEYRGAEPGEKYCYFEKIAYDYPSGAFRQVGGSDKCGGGDGF